MVINKQLAGDTETIILEGRLDANTSPELEKALPDFSQIEKLIFDIKSLEYVSSAGLRVFLAVQKKMNSLGKNMMICNASRDIMDIFDVTGFADILTVERSLREISTIGCTLIGAGCCGECWKLDDETVLKLYFEGTDRQIIEWEKKYAKEAFKLGIPTAISYNMVACGKRLGVVFEMLKAQTLSSLMKEDPEHLEYYAIEFAKLAKLVHSTEAPDGAFPDFKEQLRMYQEQNTWMTQEEHEQYLKILDSLPNTKTCIHGDFHTSNVMVQNGELMFIDMGDFSVGNPMFDIAHIYNLFELNCSEALSKSITKLDLKERKLVWRYFLKQYYGINREKEIEDFSHDIQPYVALRQVKYIPFFEETAKVNMAILREGLFKTGSSKAELTIPAKVEQLDKVLDFIHEKLGAHACPMKFQMQMDVAVEEVFVNIAHYAYKEQQGFATISCEIIPNPRQMVVTFVDKGVPYNPLAKEDPDITTSVGDRQIGGLGIFMAKKMTDTVEYHYCDGQNKLVLKKLF